MHRAAKGFKEIHRENFKMKNRNTIYFLLLNFLLAISFQCYTQLTKLDNYNVVWTSQSQNSSESMPCGGGDIGLNVWVENGEILFYISRSGTFDENNGFLKLGRVRIKLSPNPFIGNDFKQELKLREGNVCITGKDNDFEVSCNLWVDVFNPVIHLDINANKEIQAEAIYETWRYQDHLLRGSESFANSYKWSPLKGLKILRDSVSFAENRVLFYHKNKEETVFDVTVKQQGMDEVKDEMFNPLKNLIFGGLMYGKNMEASGNLEGKYLDTEFMGWALKSKEASRNHDLFIALHTEQTGKIENWEKNLNNVLEKSLKSKSEAKAKTQTWWQDYWNRSFVFISNTENRSEDTVWQIGRNFTLFRYMLGCNAYGSYPTKFNGGLFTYDPRFTDANRSFTPDYRNWGGGTFTAQNQRLVYFPMIKNGDLEMLKPQLDFYLRSMGNAELRSKVYWDHEGACFTEQIENFGLPNCTEYGWKRPDWYDKGMQYNAWLEYQWDTALEFCLMILEMHRYKNMDISEYIPFIESCLTFFNEHYQYLARLRGSKTFDENGNLILYPGSGCETYKMAYNAVSTVSALQTVLGRLLELPESYLDTTSMKKWDEMLERIPPIEFREIEGHTTIAPARLWERVNNTETAQLYPVFPWGMYGIGKPGLDIAINTWNYDPDAIKFRSHVGWKQDNIFAARLGLTDEAARLTTLKLKDSGRRFPAFWGPGFDWVPDHNWGGSGMIGLQEMLMQVDGKKIYILPAWPEEWNVHFKLHAPYSTTVEVEYVNGKIVKSEIIPADRNNDVIFMK